MSDSDKPAEGTDKAALQQLGDDPGEGGQRDITAEIRGSDDPPSEEFTGMAKTGEQSLAKGAKVEGDRSDRKD